MKPEVFLRICGLIPFIYAGLYALTDPASAIRVVNRVVEQAHQIESSTILGGLFDAPVRFTDTRQTRLFWRLTGIVVMAGGLARLYFL